MAQQVMQVESQQVKLKKINDFVVTSIVLGEGCYGKVFLGYFMSNQEKKVAAKLLSLDQITQHPKEFTTLLKREIEIMRQLNCENIVNMYEVVMTKNNLYMFLEYCNGGDLKQLIKKRTRIPEPEAHQYLLDICKAMKALWEHNFIHRDIKPANIIINDGVAKLSDFGFARSLEDKIKQGQYTLLGTPLYMAPQLLIEEEYSPKCDIWSLAFVYYEMLYGRTPWTGESPTQLYANINSQPLYFDPNIPVSENSIDFIRKCLQVPEEKRFNWNELFKHKLINLN